MTAPREARKHMSHKICGFLTPLLLVVGLAQAQTPPVSPTQAPPVPSTQAPAPATDAGFERVLLTAGRSTVLATDFDITRVAVTNPAVADAVVVQPRAVLIDG